MVRGRQLVLLAVGLLVIVSPSIGQEAIRFGVFPFLPANSLEAQVGPLLRRTSEYLQRPVEFKTRKSFSDYLDALTQGSFDIALIQPFDYVLIRDQGIYLPLVRKKDSMQANIVTANSSVKTINDLRGQIVAFPSKTAAVTLLAIRDLQMAGLNFTDYQAQFFNDHRSCSLSAINGLSKACVTVKDSSDPVITDSQLRSIKTSEFIPHILIVVKPDRFDDIEGLKSWFLSLNDSAEQRQLLQLAFLDRLEVANYNDYDIVEKIYQETLMASDFLRNHIEK